VLIGRSPAYPLNALWRAVAAQACGGLDRVAPWTMWSNGPGRIVLFPIATQSFGQLIGADREVFGCTVPVQPYDVEIRFHAVTEGLSISSCSVSTT
jgi:hypothetical protein